MIGPMRDYWLCKLFYDLQSPAAGPEYRAERDKVLDRYRIGAEVRKALAENDVPFLAQRTNAYLLRYYFFATGMKDEEVKPRAAPEPLPAALLLLPHRHEERRVQAAPAPWLASPAPLDLFVLHAGGEEV